LESVDVIVPMPEIVETSSLSVDGKNPNKMNRAEIDRLKVSFQKFGFIVPIITNKDLVIADGEQRWIAATELNMPKVIVYRLPLQEVTRLIIRQVMNKLKGEHDFQMDADEFLTIKELGGIEDLQYLIGLPDDKLSDYLNPSEEEIAFADKWEIIIECPSLDFQETNFEKLKELGYKCRLLSL